MSCIKSIQRGTGSGNATITITQVDMSKSVVLIFGGRVQQGQDYSGGISIGMVPFAYLKTSTTLIIDGAISYGNGGSNWYTINVSYAWQVIEFA